MKPLTSTFTALCLVAGLTATGSALAGRYDGLTDVFNAAAKHIDPPPPRDLDYVYRPKDFDISGLHGPDMGSGGGARSFEQPAPPPKPTLTEQFNSVN